MKTPTGRAINWFESTRRSLETRFPEIGQTAGTLTEQLAILILRCLPKKTCSELLALLPDSKAPHLPSLRKHAKCDEEASIGYPAFIKKVEQTGVAPEHARG